MKNWHSLVVSLLFLQLSGCANVPENINRTYTYAITNTDDTTIGVALRDRIAAHPGQSGFYLLADGLDAFVSRALLADYAERSIDLQYYLYHDDLVGNLLGYKLLEAADRGVRIRVLLDDIATGGRDLNMATLDSHPNVEIRLFNPFSRGSLRGVQLLTRFGDITRRMHNKSFTIDNQLTVVGGRNIGNEYFNANPDLNFGDLDVLAVGPVVREVSDSFDQYWNHELAYPVSTLSREKPPAGSLEGMRPLWKAQFDKELDSPYVSALLNSTFAQHLREKSVSFSWGEAEALYDDPEKIRSDITARELHLAPKLGPYIERLNDELIILSAYFVPGKEGVQFLQQLRQQGIRVRIVTNSLASTDVSVVHAGYAKYRKDMLRAGVELYEVNEKLSKQERAEKKGVGGSSKASLHAKAYIFDRENLFIGSFNLDPRSDIQNTELGIMFHSPEMGKRIGEWFDEIKNSGKTFQLELVTTENGGEAIRWNIMEEGENRSYSNDPSTSWWRRFWVGLASLLPIESQL